jgi:sucrose phosphorylase
MTKIKDRLKYIYPSQYEEIYEKVLLLIDKWKQKVNFSYPWVDNNDVMLITYGDGIRKNGIDPLKALKEFLDEELAGFISAVHLLPMFPYTSDDGFSISDFREVNPELGSWKDIDKLNEEYELMFDAVINHASISSTYFREFLNETDRYKNFFIEADPKKDYSKVTRPRALPLLTEFEAKSGSKYIWTTFSEDQVDFNYKEPEVLLEVLDTLLFYASKGARFLRLDAIGFAWKEDMSTCMHLPQTHELIKLMREVLEACVKGCTIITETNVPHKDNISYFGNGYDEAGLVYQFPLPPLTLHSFISGNAHELSKWAASLEETTAATTYFNFLASHDGIGMRPVEDILSEDQRNLMVKAVIDRGGQIGYRSTSDGLQVPYELNINYLDAVAGDESEIDSIVQKFMSAQCVLISVVGMPGIYYHSLLGSRNCYKDYEESGIKRRINREKLDLDQLYKELDNPNSLRRKVLDRYREMIRLRKNYKAFSPNSPQKVLSIDERIFSFLRGIKDQKILVLINVSKEKVTLNTDYIGLELFTNKKISGKICIQPYEYLWILLNEGE